MNIWEAFEDKIRNFNPSNQPVAGYTSYGDLSLQFKGVCEVLWYARADIPNGWMDRLHTACEMAGKQFNFQAWLTKPEWFTNLVDFLESKKLKNA